MILKEDWQLVVPKKIRKEKDFLNSSNAMIRLIYVFNKNRFKNNFFTICKRDCMKFFMYNSLLLSSR